MIGLHNGVNRIGICFINFAGLEDLGAGSAIDKHVLHQLFYPQLRYWPRLFPNLSSWNFFVTLEALLVLYNQHLSAGQIKTEKTASLKEVTCQGKFREDLF
jgi:hypothetical protein